MKKIKSARGKIIDMGALAKKNEEERAVGNVPMNAKGDRLGKGGKVKTTVQTISRTQHEAREPAQITSSSNPTYNKDPKKPKEEITVSEPKTRDDGSTYREVTDSSGNITVEELSDSIKPTEESQETKPKKSGVKK